MTAPVRGPRAAPGGAIRWLVRHFVLIAAISGAASYVWLFSRPSADVPIRSDGYFYYLYAPSVIVYHDLSLDALANDWNGGGYPGGIVRWPGTNRWVNRFPIGVAVMMSPFVFGADLLTRWSNFPRDGFSQYYEHAAALSGLAYFLVGLVILRRTLARYFTEAATFWTLVAVTWGTNLFHYAVYDGTFSHAFSFALICALVEVVDQWWAHPIARLSAALGAVAGLVVLTRHTNALLLLLVPAWGVRDWAGIARRFDEIWQRRRPAVVVIAVAAAVCAPQLALYKWTTGHWLVNPYQPYGVSFSFLTPHLFGALLSTQRGLFFWSPVLLFAVAGMFVARDRARDLLPVVAVVLASNAWLIASWSEWQYGAGFGHRAFIDSLALPAIYLASFFEWAEDRPRVARTVEAMTVLAVALTIVQMVQYWMRIWPVRDITWEQYRSLFLSFR